MRERHGVDFGGGDTATLVSLRAYVVDPQTLCFYCDPHQTARQQYNVCESTTYTRNDTSVTVSPPRRERRACSDMSSLQTLYLGRPWAISFVFWCSAHQKSTQLSIYASKTSATAVILSVSALKDTIDSAITQLIRHIQPAWNDA